nr:hypothetical protein [Tanacetum cinerariifolium]
MIFDGMLRNLDNVSRKILMDPRFIQTFLDKQLDELPTHKEKYDVSFHTKKVFANIKRIGKGFSGKETTLFPTMKVLDLKDELKKTKTAQQTKIDRLERRVKNLDKKQRSRIHKLKRLYKERIIDDLDADEDITLMNDKEMFDVDKDLQGEEVVVEQEVVANKEPIVDAAQRKGESSLLLRELKKRGIDHPQKLNKESSKKVEVNITQEESSKRAGDELEQETAKKSNIVDDKETTNVKQLVKIIPEEDIAIDAIPLAFKTLTVNWKIYKEGKKSYYQIIRAGGKSKNYLVFSYMLKDFDREDVETL